MSLNKQYKIELSKKADNLLNDSENKDFDIMFKHVEDTFIKYLHNGYNLRKRYVKEHSYMVEITKQNECCTPFERNKLKKLVKELMVLNNYTFKNKINITFLIFIVLYIFYLHNGLGDYLNEYVSFKPRKQLLHNLKTELHIPNITETRVDNIVYGLIASKMHFNKDIMDLVFEQVNRPSPKTASQRIQNWYKKQYNRRKTQKLSPKLSPIKPSPVPPFELSKTITASPIKPSPLPQLSSSKTLTASPIQIIPKSQPIPEMINSSKTIIAPLEEQQQQQQQQQIKNNCPKARRPSETGDCGPNKESRKNRKGFDCCYKKKSSCPPPRRPTSDGQCNEGYASKLNKYNVLCCYKLLRKSKKLNPLVPNPVGGKRRKTKQYK